MIARRTVLAAAAAWPAARARADIVLRAGDQKGGAQSLMRGAGVLDGLPYRVEWSQFPAAAPLLEALNAEAVDVSLAGDAPATFALAAGLRGKIIAAVRTTGAGTAIVVPPGSPIRAAADLKGAKIATNRGSIGHALVLALAERQHWSSSDYTLVNLLPAEARSAFANGSVDAWCSWGVYIALERLSEGARVVADGSGGVLTALTYAVASDAAIAAKRDALLDFSRRLSRARVWALANPAAYARVLAGEIGVTEAVARLTFDTDAPAPVPIDAGVVADEQIVIDRFVAAKLIPARLDAASAFDASFNAALSG